MALLPEASKICAPNPSNFEHDYQDFLSSVANGADRAQVVGIQRRFMRLYSDWFPAFDGADLNAHKAYHREVIEWWNVKETELPPEEPDQRFGLHIVILRRKLRVIWLLASSGAEDEAVHRVEQLSTHYYRKYYLDIRGEHEEQRKKVFGACNWLKGNVGKLKVCENPRCQEMTKYFVRRWSNHKYCSGPCCKEANEIRQDARAKASPPKEHKRSDLAREKMSHSATERWERERRERGLKRGEHRKRSKK